MNFFDISVFVIVVLCFIIGVFKGLMRTVLKIGATVFAVVFANLIGPHVGLALFPNIIKSDSALVQNVSEHKLSAINETVAKTIGIVLLFLILFIIFRIIAGFIAKQVKKSDRISLLDRILGGVFGLFIAYGAVSVFAFALHLIAAIITLIVPSSNIYDTIEASAIFKYFF